MAIFGVNCRQSRTLATVIKKGKAIINKILKNLKYFGYEVCPIKSLNSGWYHNHGFITDVCGNIAIYQNVLDSIDYSSFQYKPFDDSIGDSEFKYILSEIKSGDNVVDIGANVGFYTLIFSKLVGSKGKVFAFEPGIIAYNLLRVNLLVNSCDNVIMENKAIYNATDLSTMTMNLFADGANFIKPQLMESEDSEYQILCQNLGWTDQITRVIPIQTILLDDYFINNEKIDFIKMDIQGSEYLALQGMKNILSRNKGIKLTIEYAPYLHPWYNINLYEFLNYVRGLGFTIYDLEKNKSEPVTDDYLLEAYPKSRVGQMTTLLLKRA